VVSLVNGYFGRDDVREKLYVCEDMVIKGFVQVDGREICKLYVDTFFQSEGVGGELVEYAVRELHGKSLWALEKNVRAVSFYRRHGFCLTGERKLEEGTKEFLVRMERAEL
jgi:putative acetyltransferase